MASMLLRSALVAVLLYAGAAAHVSGRGHGFLKLHTHLRPEVVAHHLLSIEQEWRAQAGIFNECNSTSPDDSVVDCHSAPNAFAQSCAKVAEAMVQGSQGEKADVKEYWADVCSQQVLTEADQLLCQRFGDAVESGMSDNTFDNRENFKADKSCQQFWFKFVDDEKARIEKEEAERAAAEKAKAEKEAEERAAAEKAAEEAAEAEKAAEEKAAAEKAAEEKLQEEKDEAGRQEQEEEAIREAHMGAAEQNITEPPSSDVNNSTVVVVLAANATQSANNSVPLNITQSANGTQANVNISDNKNA